MISKRLWKAVPEQATCSEISGLIVAEVMIASKLPPLSEQIKICLGEGLVTLVDSCDE